MSVGHILEQRISDCVSQAVSDERLVGGVVLAAKEGETVAAVVAGLADRRRRSEDA
jgi:hypothetical protein